MRIKKYKQRFYEKIVFEMEKYLINEGTFIDVDKFLKKFWIDHNEFCTLKLDTYISKKGMWYYTYYYMDSDYNSWKEDFVMLNERIEELENK